MSTDSGNEPNTPTTETALVCYTPHGQSTNGGAQSVFRPPTDAEYKQIVQNPEVFLEKFRSFHLARGYKLKVPTIGGCSLDVHRLFVEVTTRGGIDKVMKDKIWKDVVFAFNFPPTITSASFTTRRYYLSWVAPFENVYFFRKEYVPSISVDDLPRSGSVNGSTPPPIFKDDASTNQLPAATPTMEPGTFVTGCIDGKFDSGYLVTIKCGSEKLRGVLYHSASEANSPQSHDASALSSQRKKRRKYQLDDTNPRPQPKRSAYNFFYTEHFERLKPICPEQEIARKIGLLWSSSTDEEKQVYKDKALRDEERYAAELAEYRCSKNPRVQ